MGQQLLDDLVAEEVRRRERVVAIDDEAVLLPPTPRSLPYQLMLVPRRPRMRFEDDGPTCAAMLHDALARLARRFGASPPLNLWIRTAPRGAEHFCWRIDIVPRLTVLAGLELGQRRAAVSVTPEQAAAELREAERDASAASSASAAPRVRVERRARRADRAGPARPARRRPRRRRADRADRLAEKIRALRIFADAEGRMNEPLGEREVLCVSQFTLYADTRRGNRPSFVGAAAPERAERALRARLRAARRRSGAASARHMEVELVNDGPVTIVVEVT